MNKDWMPVTGGILNVVCGSLNILITISLFISTLILGININNECNPLLNIVASSYIIKAILIFLLGDVSLIGGIAALRRKSWKLALAGSITSVFSILWLGGIASIIFIMLSRKDFNK